MKSLNDMIFILICMLLFPVLTSAAEHGVLSAKVLVIESAGKYQILEIEQGDDQLWVATNPIAVEVGDEIEYMGGVPMSEFYVKSLDRTFKQIIFLTNIRRKLNEAETAAAQAAATQAAEVAARVEKEEDAALATIPDDANHKNVAATSVAAPTAEEMAGLKAGITIAELFAQREALSDQLVKVRGKVMKVSRKILGRTWVTLSDGTGMASNDVLRITTQQEVEVGEILSAAGTVKINIDLGAGYKYPVILEEASFARQGE